MYWFLKSLIGE